MKCICGYDVNYSSYSPGIFSIFLQVIFVKMTYGSLKGDFMLS